MNTTIALFTWPLRTSSSGILLRIECTCHTPVHIMLLTLCQQHMAEDNGEVKGIMGGRVFRGPLEPPIPIEAVCVQVEKSTTRRSRLRDHADPGQPPGYTWNTDTWEL